jgi:adenine-specific DNA glycosylase
MHAPVAPLSRLSAGGELRGFAFRPSRAVARETSQAEGPRTSATYLYIRHKDATGQTFIAIHRRSAADIWKGLWEPVLLEDDGTELFPQYTISLFKQRSAKLFGDVKHVLTHRVILADFYLMETNERPSLPPDYQWIAEQDFEDYGKPRLIDSHIPAKNM